MMSEVIYIIYCSCVMLDITWTDHIDKSSCCFFSNCQPLLLLLLLEVREGTKNHPRPQLLLALPILLPLHTLSVLLTLAWPKHAPNVSSVFSVDMQGRYGGPKPNLTHAQDRREGGAPLLRKSSQRPNNRAVPAQGPLSAQWSMVPVLNVCLNWPVVNKEGANIDREGVIPAAEGMIVSQK